MLDFLLQYDLTTHFQAFLLGSTRLMVFAAVAPFMGNQVLNMTVRSAVVMALYLVVHPTVVSTMPVFSPLSRARRVSTHSVYTASPTKASTMGLSCLARAFSTGSSVNIIWRIIPYLWAIDKHSQKIWEKYTASPLYILPPIAYNRNENNIGGKK